MDKKDYRLKGHESFTLREGWLTYLGHTDQE